MMSCHWFNKGLDDAASGEFCNHPGNPEYCEGYDSAPNRERDLQYPEPEDDRCEEDFIDLDEEERGAPDADEKGTPESTLAGAFGLNARRAMEACGRLVVVMVEAFVWWGITPKETDEETEGTA